MIYTISKDLFDIEKLKKMETEKAAKSNQTDLSNLGKLQIYSPSNIVEFSNLSNK